MSEPPPLGVLEWHHVMLSLQLANLEVDQEGPSKKHTILTRSSVLVTHQCGTVIIRIMTLTWGH